MDYRTESWATKDRPARRWRRHRSTVKWQCDHQQQNTKHRQTKRQASGCRPIDQGAWSTAQRPAERHRNQQTTKERQKRRQTGREANRQTETGRNTGRLTERPAGRQKPAQRPDLLHGTWYMVHNRQRPAETPKS